MEKESAVADNLPVITGIGVVAPTGIGKNAHWQVLFLARPFL